MEIGLTLKSQSLCVPKDVSLGMICVPRVMFPGGGGGGGRE